MIYTGNFTKMRNNKHLAGICIARGVPKWWTGEVIPELMPSWELVNLYLDKHISDEAYTKTYKEQVLAKLDVHVIAKKLKNKVALCFCDGFCHRQLVAEWLRNAGYDVEEISGQ